MICPRCESEYREGFTMCADCNVALVHGPSEHTGAGADAGAPAELQRVLQTRSPKLLEDVVRTLEAYEIPYLVQLGTAIDFEVHKKLEWRAELHVPGDRVRRAAEIISAAKSQKGDGASTDCPFCKTGLRDSEQLIACDSCGTKHHLGCWYEKDGCSVYGCSGNTGRLI